jgi:hypothetical protein
VEEKVAALAVRATESPVAQAGGAGHPSDDMDFGFESRSPAASTSEDDEMEDAPPATRVETERQVAQAGGVGTPSVEPESRAAPPPSRGGGSDNEDEDDDSGGLWAASPAGWADDDDDDDILASVPAAPAPPAVLVAPLATSVAGALLVPSDLAPLPCYRCFRAAFSGAGPLAAPDYVFVGGSLRCAHTSCRGKGNCRPVRSTYKLRLGRSLC